MVVTDPDAVCLTERIYAARAELRPHERALVERSRNLVLDRALALESYLRSDGKE